MLNKNDLVLSPTTKRMADTLPLWMSARSNYITDKYITSESEGSSWQLFVNSIAIQIDELNASGLSGCNATLTVPEEITSIYIVSTPSDVYDIDNVCVYNDGNLITLSNCEYIWDFYYGSPINVETTLTSQILHYELSNVACSINYVSSDNVDVAYIQSNGLTSTDLIFSEPIDIGKTLRISFRTFDCYYHDRLNHILFLRKQYDNMGTGNIYIESNDKWYPNEKIINTGYLPESKRYYNVLDSLGLLCDMPRLENEEDSDYKIRLENAYIYRPGCNITGIRNIIANKLGIVKRDTWADDRDIFALNDVWEDSVTIDNKFINYYKLKQLGMSLPGNVINSTVRIFRNGDLKCITDDYTISNSVVSLIPNISSTENILIDYFTTGNFEKIKCVYINNALINGITSSFEIPSHLSNKLQVFKGGIRLSSVKDYTEFDNLIEFKDPPLSGENVAIIYFNNNGNQYSLEREYFKNVNGSTSDFTSSYNFDMVFVFRNGLFMYEDVDYTINENTIHFIITPSSGSIIELQTITYDNNNVGGVYEQIQFSNNTDGGIVFNIGLLEPSASFGNAEILLQYLGNKSLNINDIYVTAYITSTSEYVTEKKYANEQTYTTADTYTDVLDNRKYENKLIPQQYGWSEYKSDSPGYLYGYIAECPQLDISLSYYNLTNPSSELMVNGDTVRCLITYRNSGQIDALNVTIQAYTTQYFELLHLGGGSFQLSSTTPRALSHTVKYIKTNKWSDVADSINVYALHDPYYINKFLISNDEPTDELRMYAKTINNISRNIWDTGKWGRSYWTKYEHVYGDIDENNEYDLNTLYNTVSSVKTIRNNYSFIPHNFDIGLDHYAKTEIVVDRCLDCRSGVGYGDQLNASVDIEEYTNIAGYSHYTFPVYVNNGFAYLNDIETYQYGREQQIVYYNTNSATTVNVPYAENIKVYIYKDDVACKARKTCFYDDGQPTHDRTEIVSGNGRNKNLKIEFKDVTINSIYYNDELVSSACYTVVDNIISFVDGSPGVITTSDNINVIDTDSLYTISYELNNSFFIDILNNIYVNTYSSTIIVSYETSDKYKTNIIANPMYSPHTQKFIYADIFEPEPISLSIWLSPYSVLHNSGEPVYVTAELMDKHGTPCSGKSIIFTGITTTTLTTNNFGRCVYIFDAPAAISDKIITATYGSLTDSCTLEVY